MKQYRFPDNIRWKTAFGVLLFAMLFLARDTLLTTAILGFGKSQFLMLGLICAAGIGFLTVNRRNLKEIIRDRRMPAILAATVILLVPMIFKRDWQLMYFSILICLYFAIFLSFFVSYKETAKYYVLILTGLGLYSVIATYLLRIPVDSGAISVPVFYNSLDVKFHNFVLAFVSDSYVKNRNFGIFREPGVYQYFILIALFLNNHTVSWRKQSHMWLVNALLAVTMLSTFATGGVVELGLFAVVLFFDKKLYQDKRACIAAVSLIALAVAAVAIIIVQQGQLYWELYGMLVGKFLPGQESGSDRINAIFINLRYFLKNPILGAPLSAVLHSMENNTSSTMILYAVLGVFGGTLNVVGWAALVWEKERKIWANLALLVILFMSFNTQNLIADVFFWLFPCMALVERGLPLLEAAWQKRKKV